MRIGKIHVETQINIEAIHQYILIYLMIQYIGGRILAALGSDLFYGGCILYCVFLMATMPRKFPIKKSVFSILIILLLSMALTFAITGGDLGIGTILSVLSRFLIVYVAINMNSELFLTRLLKLAFLMAIISLVEFAFVQFIGTTTAESLFSHLYRTESGQDWLGDSYGLFFISYSFMDPTRNTYIFGEPGEYQSLIITVLYFLAFYEDQVDISQSKKRIYFIVFLITMVTIQSTSGYFNLIVFAIAILIKRRDELSGSMRKIIIAFIAVVVVYLVFFYSQNSFLYTNFVAKIINDSETLDLSVSSGEARTASAQKFMATILNAPLRLIFGVGFDGLESLPLGGYTTCGLINSIAMLGIVSSVIMYGHMLRSFLRYHKELIQVIFVLFVVINMGLSQPDVLAIMSVLMLMYEFYVNVNRKTPEMYVEQG